jgi:hypothetical protein
VKEPVAPTFSDEKLAQIAADLGGDVDQRRQGARRGHRIAGASHDARAVLDDAEDMLHEGGLTDASLAAEEEQPSLPVSRVAQPALDLGKLRLAFEECHPRNDT